MSGKHKDMMRTTDADVVFLKCDGDTVIVSSCCNIPLHMHLMHIRLHSQHLVPQALPWGSQKQLMLISHESTLLS